MGLKKANKTSYKKGNVPWMKGKKHTKETRERMSLAKSKENHPKWKSRRIKSSDGYILVLMPDHPFHDCRGYVREHRLIAENKIGRYLKPEEVIHHVNNIRTDNREENLMLFKNNQEHNDFENRK